jgi:hypothetical protein
MNACIGSESHINCQRTKRDRNNFSIDAGGGERARTDGLLLAKQALSQLSYTPLKILKSLTGPCRLDWWAWMELNHRPHAYQACALTRLSYRPLHALKFSFFDQKRIFTIGDY